MFRPPGHISSKRGDVLRSRVESIGHGHGSGALIVVGTFGWVKCAIGRRISLGAPLDDSGKVGFLLTGRMHSVILVIGDIGVCSSKTRSTLLGGSVVVLCKVAD